MTNLACQLPNLVTTVSLVNVFIIVFLNGCLR